MSDVWMIIADTTRLTFGRIAILYEHFGVGAVFITVMFLFGVYRFFLVPMFGQGQSSRGSDKVRKEIHGDKRSAENG